MSTLTKRKGLWINPAEGMAEGGAALTENFTTIGDAIESNAAGLTAEATERAQDDAALSVLIANESAARDEADAALSGRCDSISENASAVGEQLSNHASNDNAHSLEPLRTTVSQLAESVTTAGNTLTNHVGNTANPHATTAEQVGADAAGSAAAAQAYARQRSNHTGTQTLATISDAGTAASHNVGTGSGQLAKLGTTGGLTLTGNLSAVNVTASGAVSAASGSIGNALSAGTMTVNNYADIQQNFAGAHFAMLAAGLTMKSGYVLNWTSTDRSGAADVGLARNAAGVLRITNGGTGTGSLVGAGVTATGAIVGSSSLTIAGASTLTGRVVCGNTLGLANVNTATTPGTVAGQLAWGLTEQLPIIWDGSTWQLVAYQ